MLYIKICNSLSNIRSFLVKYLHLSYYKKLPSECSWMVCFCPTLLFVNYFFIVIIKNFNVVN